MISENLFISVLSLVGGGSLVAVVNAIAGRKKNNSDISQSNIDAAIKLRNEAIESYLSTESKLQACRELLSAAEDDLRRTKKYVSLLEDLLDSNNIDYDHLKNPYVNATESYKSQNDDQDS